MNLPLSPLPRGGTKGKWGAQPTAALGRSDEPASRSSRVGQKRGGSRSSLYLRFPARRVVFAAEPWKLLPQAGRAGGENICGKWNLAFDYRMNVSEISKQLQHYSRIFIWHVLARAQVSAVVPASATMRQPRHSSQEPLRLRHVGTSLPIGVNKLRGADPPVGAGSGVTALWGTLSALRVALPCFQLARACADLNRGSKPQPTHNCFSHLRSVVLACCRAKFTVHLH